MITAWGTKDGVATVIGVDFGHKNDYAVKTVLKKHPDGRVEVVSSEPIGRTIDFGTDIHIYTGNPSVLGGISF